MKAFIRMAFHHLIFIVMMMMMMSAHLMPAPVTGPLNLRSVRLIELNPVQSTILFKNSLKEKPIAGFTSITL